MTATIWLAIIGSGALSVVVSMLLNWLKEYLNNKKVEEARIKNIQENIYKEIITNIDFLYPSSKLTQEERDKKQNIFLKNYRLMFIYCSDSIIKAINSAIASIEIPSSVQETDKTRKTKETFSRSIITIREQFNNKTSLLEGDFKHVG